MKFLLNMLILLLTGGIISGNDSDNLKAGFTLGNPAIKSVNALAFGPEGILFIGDSKNAEIFAIDTKDTDPATEISDINLQNVDQKLAQLLGTTPDAIVIQDLAVNPLSRRIYLAVHANDHQPLIFYTDGKDLAHMPLESVSFSKQALSNPVSSDAKDHRDRPLRKWAISDLKFYQGKVMVSGLSNAEFSSTFRSIPFPFSETADHASLEIYHAAHGQYETHAPIKTFIPYQLKGKPHLIASYTCTPLVVFPLEKLKEGSHTMGQTVAELGNRNTPLDFVAYNKEGKPFILLANTSRALMKLDPEKIAEFDQSLSEPVKENSATAGIDFIALPYVNVQQMDNYGEDKVLLLQRMSDGALNLKTADVGRL